jgi:hypothetical protein
MQHGGSVSDPDPALILSADPDPWCQSNADLDSGKF